MAPWPAEGHFLRDEEAEDIERQRRENCIAEAAVAV